MLPMHTRLCNTISEEYKRQKGQGASNMMTTTISDYRVVEQDDPSKMISFNVFTSREEAEKWIESRKEDIDLAVNSGWLKGVMVHETKIPARFIIAKPSMSHNYLAFGARVLEEVVGAYKVAAGSYKVIGVPVEHAKYLTMRLASGLELASRDHNGYTTLEEAVEDAVRLA